MLDMRFISSAQAPGVYKRTHRRSRMDKIPVREKRAVARLLCKRCSAAERQHLSQVATVLGFEKLFR